MPVTRRTQDGMYKPYVREAIRLEQAVQELLDAWANTNDDIVLKHSGSTGIKDIQKLTTELLRTVSDFLAEYGIIMDAGIQSIAKVKATQALEESIPLLRSLHDNEGVAYFKRDMDAFSSTVGSTWMAVGVGAYSVNFLQRQKAIELSTKKTISNIITMAKKENMGGQQVQKILRDYVNPSDKPGKPFDIARQALGASKKYVPKDVLAGSVQTNLYETTRNESAEMWRNMTEMAYENALWVEGYDWTLSRSHPHPDMCDDLASDSPYPKDEPRPRSHSHCLCDWVAHLRPRAELEDILKKSGSLYNGKRK